MGLIRKLLIFASANGLVLQAHGPVDHHKAIQIAYRSRVVEECSPGEAEAEAGKGGRGPHLEAFGVLGTFPLSLSVRQANDFHIPAVMDLTSPYLTLPNLT
jgi:hypothetical protein